jgi:hypothetical protein
LILSIECVAVSFGILHCLSIECVAFSIECVASSVPFPRCLSIECIAVSIDCVASSVPWIYLCKLIILMLTCVACWIVIRCPGIDILFLQEHHRGLLGGAFSEHPEAQRFTEFITAVTEEEPDS